ncbi:MAG: undecaprenyldiphospho-muramoylpentapeptide beta-N-acetylglucosaminyltransferase [Acidobacteria bacterium]|nr:undecaprenyldiphospho-muramoylpentapeptide beta-N-acetylglucosaminyltransferase [Acidobacteriota bacterium]
MSARTAPSNARRPILFAGGGTGGHVIPLIAVAEELRRRGREARFVGTRSGIEARLVPARGFAMDFIDIGGLKRVGVRQTLTTLWQLPVSTLRMWRRLRELRVAALFSLGGYVAAPAVLAALALGIPVVAMEPNAVPGMTNRRLGRFAATTLLGFPEAAAFFPPGKSEATGLPVREEFFALPPKPRGERLHLLITGGSRGSRTLNEASRASWKRFRETGRTIEITHQSGADRYEELRAEFAATGLPGRVTPFLEDMPAAFAQADLVVCRSGAGAVAELAAAGKPGVLVPFPFAADDHQSRNAAAFERAGAARLIPDKEMTGDRLFQVVTELAAEPGRLERMGEAARGLGRPGAARRAADILEEFAGANRR